MCFRVHKETPKHDQSQAKNTSKDQQIKEGEEKEKVEEETVYCMFKLVSKLFISIKVSFGHSKHGNIENKCFLK